MATVETGVAGGVSFALTDEQRELRALARSFAEKEIRPRAAECDEHQTHAADIIAKAHEVGLMNLHLPESLGGPELPCFDGMLVGEELNWGCSGHRHLDPRERPRRRPDPDRRHRGAEEAVARPARRGARSSAASGSPSRAPARTSPGSRRPPSAGATSTSSTARRCSSRTPATRRGWSASPRPTSRQGAQGPLGVRDPDGRSGRHDREAPRQDGPAGDGHLGRRVPGRRRARREPARRRGRGLQDRDADARLHASRHRGRRRRRRPGGVRARGRVHEGARPVRDADRDEPGRQLPRRRHGDGDRGGAAAHAGRPRG